MKSSATHFNSPAFDITPIAFAAFQPLITTAPQPHPLPGPAHEDSTPAENTMMTLPEGWTDDMRISIDPMQMDGLVSFLFDGHARHADWEEMCERIMLDFGLTEEDANLAIDRVKGGMVRAVTGDPANRPSSLKDPLAHMSFERIWSELPRKHIFSRRKNSDGKWSDWFHEGQRRMG